MCETLPNSGEVKNYCDIYGVHHFKEMVQSMPLQEASLYYVDFLTTRLDKRYNHDEILDDLAQKLEEATALSEMDKWLVEVMVNVVGDESDELVKMFDGSYYSKPLLRILGRCTESREIIIPIFMKFMRVTQANDRLRIFERMYTRVGSAMSFRLIGEYFKDTSEVDTFLSGGIFGVVTEILDQEVSTSWRGSTWDKVSGDTIRSLDWCLKSIEEALPTLDERGHTGIALRGSKQLIEKYPEIKNLMGSELLGRLRRLKEK